MNKQLIVLLAVCLISVQCFVKRDAEKTATDDLMNNISELGNNINNKLKETFNPEEMKKGLDEFLDKMSQGIKDLREKTKGSPQQ